MLLEDISRTCLHFVLMHYFFILYAIFIDIYNSIIPFQWSVQLITLYISQVQWSTSGSETRIEDLQG